MVELGYDGIVKEPPREPAWPEGQSQLQQQLQPCVNGLPEGPLERVTDFDMSECSVEVQGYSSRETYHEYRVFGKTGIFAQQHALPIGSSVAGLQQPLPSSAYSLSADMPSTLQPNLGAMPMFGGLENRFS